MLSYYIHTPGEQYRKVQIMRYIISSRRTSPLAGRTAQPRTAALAAGALALWLLAGPAVAAVPAVVTDIPPVHALAAAVMGNLGTPVLLLEPGASPHSFALRPSQSATVASADLVIWIGPELTPWLEKPLQNRPADAADLALLQAEGTERRSYGAADEEGHAKDHDEDHDEGNDEGHDEGHGHAGLDPHAWLDPGNGRHWLTLISAELSRLDPDNAATYAANAAAAAAAIDAADARAAALLAPVRDRPFLAFHDAYGYFTAHYGLQMAGTVALGDAAAPGARHLAELRARVEAGGIGCLFPEAQHDPALLDQIAEGTGARIGGALDPEGSTLPPGPDLYPALLLTLAETLAACQP